MAGFCEYGNEPSGSIDCGEYFDYPTNCQLLKNTCRGVSLLVIHGILEAKLSNSSPVPPKFHTLSFSFHRRSVILVSEGFVNTFTIRSKCVKQIAVAVLNKRSSVRIALILLLKRVFRYISWVCL